MTRERLPDRRLSWTQKAQIGPEGQTFYLTCGEYADGWLGEIFLEAHKEGTFARGVLSALARMLSIALQNGTPVEEIVRSLRHLNFPPRGDVRGSAAVAKCASVCDWIELEIEAAYLRPPAAAPAPAQVPALAPEPESPGPEKAAGRKAAGSGV